MLANFDGVVDFLAKTVQIGRPQVNDDIEDVEEEGEKVEVVVEGVQNRSPHSHTQWNEAD